MDSVGGIGMSLVLPEETCAVDAPDFFSNSGLPITMTDSTELDSSDFDWSRELSDSFDKLEGGLSCGGSWDGFCDAPSCDSFCGG